MVQEHYRNTSTTRAAVRIAHSVQTAWCLVKQCEQHGMAVFLIASSYCLDSRGLRSSHTIEHARCLAVQHHSTTIGSSVSSTELIVVDMCRLPHYDQSFLHCPTVDYCGLLWTTVECCFAYSGSKAVRGSPNFFSM